jgi:hypothetical protein
MRLFRLALGAALAALGACSVVNSVDDPVPANSDSGEGGATPVGCPEGFEACSGACVRTDNDPAHCGACGAACAADQVCGLSQCLANCPEGQTACDGSCVDLQTDPAHCGGCGDACMVGANATASCTAGACGVVCETGFDDCDADPTDCEANVASDPANCGTCGNGCIARANAAPSCSGGTCGLGACNAGYEDCDGFAETGCEAHLMTSEGNCMTCGNACAANQVCAQGTCLVPYFPSGVQTNVAATTLTSAGWIECFSDTYNQTSSVQEILEACDGDRLALACRPAASATLSVVAAGMRNDVTADCSLGATGCSGASLTCTTVANGVGWYFNPEWSWGFAPAGQAVSKCSCDTEPGLGTQRICWHASSGNITNGYRCGDTFDSSYERVIYHIP